MSKNIIFVTLVLSSVSGFLFGAGKQKNLVAHKPLQVGSLKLSNDLVEQKTEAKSAASAGLAKIMQQALRNTGHSSWFLYNISVFERQGLPEINTDNFTITLFAQELKGAVEDLNAGYVAECYFLASVAFLSRFDGWRAKRDVEKRTHAYYNMWNVLAKVYVADSVENISCDPLRAMIYYLTQAITLYLVDGAGDELIEDIDCILRIIAFGTNVSGKETSSPIFTCSMVVGKKAPLSVELTMTSLELEKSWRLIAILPSTLVSKGAPGLIETLQKRAAALAAILPITIA